MVETLTPVQKDSINQIHSALADRISKEELKLPLLPLVATEILNLTNDPDADITKLAALIQQDQAVASQVLKISNSAAYAPRSPIVSMQQAVSWLGMKMLGELALAVSIENGIFRIKGYDKEISSLWRHALASGLYAKEIARLERQNVEGAFLCGLLHTIGKPIVLQAALEIQHSMDVTLDWNSLTVLLEIHHCYVGAMVAEKWSLPSQVQDAILHYQDYSSLPNPSPAVLATCLSDRLGSYLLGLEAIDPADLASLPVVEALNLYPEDMEELLAKGEAILQAVDAMIL